MSWDKNLTDLGGILEELYPQKDDSQRITSITGIENGSIYSADEANHDWHNILAQAEAQNKVKDIVQIAITDFPERQELDKLYYQVENMQPLTSTKNLIKEIESSYAPDSTDNVTDTIQINELLIPKREELERSIGQDELVDILSWVEGASKQSKAVCKIERQDGTFGTGFLLKGGYLITNNHVISNAEEATRSRIIFNYRIDGQNNVLPHETYQLDTSTFISSPEKDLDYTIVKVMDKETSPLNAWGFVELEDFLDPKVGEKVTIIQHPNGNTMKMALPDNVISIWDNHIFYATDTQPGSSGSPVFNKRWRVVALHHAGKNEDSNEGGLQINAQGAIQPANRGILIKKIIDDLKNKAINLNF